MLSRFTAVGTTADDKTVLLAYELNEEQFRITLYLTPRAALTNEQAEFIETKWVEGEPFEFPAETLQVHPNLHAETILPADILSKETGKIRIKQNEWAYQLLTAKLWESFLLELEELKKKAEELTQYDRQLFDDAKGFWVRVLEHRKERDISQERLDKIKEDVNSIFEKLKTFRKQESAEFEAASAQLRDAVLAKLEELKKKADEKANFKQLTEELKALQQEARKSKYTKNDDGALRKAFDAAFQYINDQRNHFFSDKNATRIKGLTEVIQKMEASLQRDKKDLEYLDKKASSPAIKSLELQLINVKKNLVVETINSKEEKLKDIRATLEKLQKQTERTQRKKEETGQEGDIAETVAETEVVVENTSGEEATSSPTE